MRRDWEPDLVAHWTLVDDDWRLVANKTGRSRLGFASTAHADELPPDAVAYVATQVVVDAAQLPAAAQ